MIVFESKGRGGKGGGSKGGGNGNGGNWPSTTGNPSGGGRGNGPGKLPKAFQGRRIEDMPDRRLDGLLFS